ncbi:hypothetical protein AVEN_90521-1 [Araneus ventricosus]|uniref:HTH psq-type domain-containing protein n=1 Tax=Araneus ventricosus TaxID=182803 RepID=A0A4Y2R6G3_ARAVE|nr:hypothetical protein AVEN_90521-1 [Araneus ventricosus]
MAPMKLWKQGCQKLRVTQLSIEGCSFFLFKLGLMKQSVKALYAHGKCFQYMWFLLCLSRRSKKKMVRNYKPKSVCGKVDGSLMKRAVEEVMKGHSVRQTSKHLAIDHITLSWYVKKYQSGKAKDDNDFSPHFNTRMVFSKQQEDVLEE